MKNEIEKAIKAILVIKNPESIWRAVDRITSIVERDQALNTSSVSICCDMSVCMKLPKCSRQCKDCASVQ
jgi:hypothetical protein